METGESSLLLSAERGRPLPMRQLHLLLECEVFSRRGQTITLIVAKSLGWTNTSHGKL